MGGNVWTLVFLFSLSFINGSTSKPSTKENYDIDPGWRPISREEVFNKIERRLSYGPLEENLSFEPSRESNKTALVLVNLNNKYDEKLTKENVSNKHKHGITFTNSDSDMEYKLKEKSKYLSVNDSNLKKMNNTVCTKSERKPKKILDEIMNEPTNNILYKQGPIDSQKILRGEDKDLQNKYEVTEALESTPELKYGYVYNPPLSTTNNNLTSHLLNILSKYNIKADDDLPNYALSTKKIRLFSPGPGFIDARLPLRHSRKCNSLNHVSVDPMLAVFLSNYGYYLPGVYGFTNNYRNLYGNLASNNLHNNKPFGFYKIFSDTDSYI